MIISSKKTAVKLFLLGESVTTATKRTNTKYLIPDIRATHKPLSMLPRVNRHGPQGRGYNNWFLRIRKKQKSLGADQRAKALAELI